MIRVNDLWPEPARERTPRRSLLVTLPAWGGVGAIDDGPVGQERSGGSVVAPPPITDSEFIEPPVMPNMRAPESGGDKPGITPPPNPYPENWKAPGVTSPHEAWEECCTAWQAAGLAARDTPDGECRAPHCWSEYGTPCATCPKEKR